MTATSSATWPPPPRWTNESNVLDPRIRIPRRNPVLVVWVVLKEKPVGDQFVECRLRQAVVTAEPVPATTTVEPVVTFAAEEHVIVETATQVVFARIAADEVVSPPAANEIVALSA